MLLFSIIKYITIILFAFTLLFLAIAAIGLHLPKANTKLRDMIFEIAIKISFTFCFIGSISLLVLPIVYLIAVI